jgi:hypothetical protein
MWLSIPLKSAPAWACLARDFAPGSPEWASTLASAATLNGKHTQPQSWQRAWKKDRWMQHLSGPTFSPSTLQPGLEQWIASLRASRARTCPLRGDGPGLMANEAASSSTSSILPTLAVRDTSFWRTSQASLVPPPPLWTKPKGLSTSARPPASWENWPTAGGMRNGSLFQRPTWAPAMGGKGGSAGRGEMWPTATATDCEQAGGPNANHVTLNRAGTMWMTPNVPNRGAGDMDQLSNFVAHSSHLAQPMPDGPPSCGSGPDSPQPSTKRLNPAFGEWLMGWPIGSHDCRAQRLKCVGNGVVALCAAAAVVQLVQRMKGANP